MKVLVSDNLGEVGIKMFQEAQGIDVDVKTGLAPEELKAIIGEYDALVIRSATKVTEDLLDAAVNLKVVGRAGIGLDNVDIPAATSRGVVVMNTPTGNVITTAEHAIAMMMSLTRHIPAATASLKGGRWEKKSLAGRELYKKTLGLIGYGKIGAIVADRARGLKMRVVVYDPYVTPEKIQNDGFEPLTLEELYKQADYITVHVPKMKTTAGLLNKDAFEQMKNGVMIINCARGGIVNEADLYEAIVAGKVGGAALDVFETEPPGQLPLLELDKVICTPHLGASTMEAQTNVAVMVAQQIIDYLTTGTIVNAVNVPSVTGEVLEKVGPYLKLAEQLGALQAQLIKGAPREMIIEYYGDFKGVDLSPVTTALLKGLLAPMVKEVVNFVNAHVLANQRGIKVTETTIAAHKEYTYLITAKLVTTEGENVVSGTIFGKEDTRVVRINTFRLEMIPLGHMALIYNQDIPGSIGEIGTCLGKHNINIARMQVGQEEGGDRNIIFLCTDTPIPSDVVAELRGLKTVKNVTPLEF
ncbi:phosphoglycerate dehydrogenase [Desulfatitalea tepidiphila]|uniref:phosphoglycerate dehydrogenase n=1 Tax=Desulfatitalea tepidiphila TaxID=1185843 RepID=UPI0006B673B7|nr:phosphoglycerate dehydrogenase [Desulfatitalea tepidiphila]